MLKFDKRITSLSDFAEEIDDHKDLQNYFHDELTECYKIVEDFIKRNDRILVGGMAIDYALKDKGSFLYSKNKIDYDFLSPEFHRDAYKLGDILAKKFDGISVIGALHATTMRVRYKFMPVADITYAPLILYDKLKSINYQGFRCIHPHIQMIDQMRSIIYMAENPPRESFFGDRIAKDIKRFCMLAEFYPMPDADAPKMVHKKIPIAWLKGNCLGGIVAGAYWSKKLNLNLHMNVDVHKDDVVIVTIPDDAKITIYSDEPDKLIDLIGGDNKKKYRDLLDKLPERTELTTNIGIVEVINSSASLLLADKTDDFHIITIYGVLLYLFTLDTFIESQSLLSTFYNAILLDFKSDLKTFPTHPEFYGKNNWSESYLLSLKKQSSGNTALLPRNAYPEKNKPVAPDAYNFDPSKSEILQNDGSTI